MNDLAKITIYDLAVLLANNIKKNRLYVALPTLEWSFGEDNAHQLVTALTQDLDEASPLIIRQFTNIQSSVPFPNDTSRFLPVKRLATMMLSPENNEHPVQLLSKEDTRAAYSVDAQTGKKIALDKDLVFVNAADLLARLEQVKS